MINKLRNLRHIVEAVLANIYYGFPARKLTVIGVTGTDGKTTTTHLIFKILSSKYKNVSMISTVVAQIGEIKLETGLHTTTPTAFLLQKLLRNAVDQGSKYLVLEVTSHAIAQHRIFGINFDIAVITNVTLEHLDYHGTYDSYLETKSKLLLSAKTAIINRDDISYDKLLAILKSKNKKFKTYGLENPTDFSLDFKKKLGEDLTKFNNYNYLAAYSATRSLGIEESGIISSLKNFVLPEGRMDIVYDKSFKIIVDFAHTPNGILNILSSLDEMKKNNGRLIHVFGSAGLRDRSKRSVMGEISGKNSNVIIITEEDHRTEDPMTIAREISQGVEKSGFTFQKPDEFSGKENTYTIILNRQEAIKKAIEVAKLDDIIILTGKGHEKSLCRGKTEYPWDEKKVVTHLLQNLND